MSPMAGLKSTTSSPRSAPTRKSSKDTNRIDTPLDAQVACCLLYRFASPAPLLLPRRSVRDAGCTIRKYRVGSMRSENMKRSGREIMSTLRLAVGCGDYDRTRALFDGTTQAEGIELDWEPAPVPHELFVRVLRGKFDVSEMSLSGLTSLIARGGTDLVGIPV